MSKIRINELARELEVKPTVILEVLPELGITDKKTHSSSLDDDLALEIRRRVAAGFGHEHGAPDDHPSAEPAGAAESSHGSAHAARPAEESHAPPVARHEPEKKEAAEEPAPAAPRAAQPLRPPLSSGSPLAPPLAPRGMPIPVRPAPPPPKPGQIISGPRQPMPPLTPHVPPAATISHPVSAKPSPAPAAPAPAAPAPAASSPAAPATDVSPRTPVTTPGAPRPSPLPSMPVPRPAMRPPAATVAPGPGAPSHPAPHVGQHQAPHPGQHQHPTTQHPGQHAGAHPGTLGSGGPLRPPAKSNLAGQPVARPVVPPRPDLVAKLTRAPGAPAPGLPRPGVPTRPASPVPGQPIYRGTVRPGQPLMRAPGGGPGMGPRPSGGPGGYRGPTGPGGPGRGRPMHPTSEPATMPVDPGRRHATKPGSGRTDNRRRDVDSQEGRLRPVARRQQEFVPPDIDREITLAEGITVKELSEKLGVKANLVVKRLVDRKIFATINQTMDVKLAEELARDFGASTNRLSYEEETTHDIQQTEVDQDREKRPPVVTIMGHVDHGKTSLLDAIRSANVAGREAGGITQHIGAYHVEKNGQKIVFIDTPGHEAFTRMRARGAKVTDIVILVVAADDGVMPQTLEAIDHAKLAGVPIIVAINKIDKPDAQPERIKQQLADRGLLAEDWGGDVVMVPVSARAKTNLDLLLEMILLVAEMLNLRANAARPAMGNVLEAKLDRARGPVATVLVRNGSLKVGDHFICGSVFGKVRALFNDQGEGVREVGPSMPVEVLGLDAVPDVGDTFQVVTDTAKAKQIVIYREAKAREVAMSKNNRLTLDQLHTQMKEGEVKELNIILKTDVGGTAEVLTDTLQKLSNEKVRIRVLRAGVGAITESDVLLATTSDAIIIGFNVRPERNAQTIADQEKVDIRLHTIIYELADEMKRAMTGMLDPVFKEVFKGRAEVRDVFRISKVGAVAGCMVNDGVITRNSQVRLLRDNVIVHTGKVENLKRFKNDASEVKAGFECGISLANFNDIKPGDIIEAFVTEKVAQEALV
ncbi:MAG: translation initiation factor IF-2 [Acidobacteriota bacterium]